MVARFTSFSLSVNLNSVEHSLEPQLLVLVFYLGHALSVEVEGSSSRKLRPRRAGSHRDHRTLKTTVVEEVSSADNDDWEEDRLLFDDYDLDESNLSLVLSSRVAAEMD
ncbi:unnamed protein product [Linum trigynum]|uniref:Uncharacterized protein n=1 Tax=Linum trigynum TaxID=586398 RepID=A0AAV2GNQ8_9ROSI